MQETVYQDRNDGSIKRMVEMFSLPADGRESALKKRYDAALANVFGEGHDIISIRQSKIGRNDPCPCGSGMKFKRCCEARMNVALATGD